MISLSIVPGIPIQFIPFFANACAPRSVSYTHLDVYKRQLDNCIETWAEDQTFIDFISTYFPEYYFNSFKNAIFKFENLSNTIYDFDNYIDTVKKDIYYHIINNDDDAINNWPISNKIIELLHQQATMGLNKVYELASYASSHNLSFYYQNPFGDKPKKADLPSPYDCHLKYYFDVIKAIRCV